MEVVIYNKEGSSGPALLHGMVERVTGRRPVNAYSLDELFGILKSRVSGEMIIIFVIRAESELDALTVRKSKLLDSRIIIVLPEEEGDLTAKALTLHPRYMGYGNGGYADVGAVLSKMLS